MNRSIFRSLYTASAQPSGVGKMLLAFVLSLLACTRAEAQKDAPAAEDKSLAAIFKNIREADGYAYNALIEFFHPGDTQKLQEQHMLSYSDPSAFVFYRSSANSLFLLSKKGEFTVDSARKFIVYTVITNEEQRAERQQQYNKANNGMMDSILLGLGNIRSKVSTKQKLKYQVTYPPGCNIRELEITARSSDYFPEKVVYTMIHPVSPAMLNTLICQKVTTTGYVQKMPPALKALLGNEAPLREQLASLYPGFKLLEKNN